MKRIAHYLLLGAAAMIGQIASAETVAVFTAPFSFRTPTGVMPAGSYQLKVENIGGSPLASIKHQGTLHGQLFLVNAPAQGMHSPSLTFTCKDGQDCYLASIKTSFNSYAVPTNVGHDRQLYTIKLKVAKRSGD